MKIGIMGYYPPPIGGITIHVKRLGELLQQSNIDYKTYSISTKNEDSKHLQLYNNRRKWALSYFFKHKEDLIHCHTMGWSEKAYYVMLAKLFRKKSMITFHSYRDGLSTQKGMYKWSLKFVRKHADHFVAVGIDDYNLMVADGFDKDKISLIPGFIAPKEENLQLPKYIDEFIKSKAFTFCGNAASNNHYKGEDLYGIDLMIEAVAKVKNQGIDCGCVFFMGSVSNTSYYEKLQQRIVELGIEEDFLFCQESIGFYHVIKETHVFVRPTNTDGDAISIREGLYYSKPVIASDVVKRPTGTITFKNRDVNDLVTKLLEVYKHKGEDPSDQSEGLGIDYGLEVIKLYKTLLYKEGQDE